MSSADLQKWMVKMVDCVITPDRTVNRKKSSTSVSL